MQSNPSSTPPSSHVPHPTSFLKTIHPESPLPFKAQPLPAPHQSKQHVFAVSRLPLPLFPLYLVILNPPLEEYISNTRSFPPSQVNGTAAPNTACFICAQTARTTVVAKASKVVQSTGKALVSSAAKKTGFLGPTLSGTGNTQKKV
jgi:hypothetical protein